MRLPSPPLLLITDRRQAGGDVAEAVAAALAAGCRWVSLREKDLPEEEQVRLAARLVALGRRHAACITVHGAPGLARAAQAAGVHLAGGSDAAAARRVVGPAALVGLSVHTVAEAATVRPGVVDYVVAAPVFLTQSKPGYGPALGLDGLAAIAAASPVPVLALGGVDASNARACLAAGAAGIAVMGGVMRAADPGAETERLLAALARRPAS